MRAAVATATVGVVLALTPDSAQSQVVCGGNKFATCASVSVGVLDLGGGITQITISVLNASGQFGTFAGTVFTDIGIWGLGNFSYVANSLTVNGAPSTAWALDPNGLNGAGIQNKVSGAGSTSPTVQNGLAAGPNPLVFVFRISGIDPTTIDIRDWALHGQAGPAGCSTKLVSTNAVVNNGPYDPACGVDPGTGLVNVVPEPASMILLATGLAGVGAGAAARRRRKKV